ncbi:hypothetical protein [Allomuricauda sp. d1]|uniref:hypothetical protein n=1 Tax=Allomuricauda sp. d1 TaxID=3136725 RepID=UPI0031DFFA3E
MKPTITIFCLLVAFNGFSQLERDKALHFLGGNLFGLAGAGIAKNVSDGNRFWTFAGAVGGATLVGLGKEAIDSGQRENGWDNDDLLATILGGVTVGVTIDLFTDHKRNKKRRERKEAEAEITFQYPTGQNSDVLASQNKSLPSLSSLGLSQHLKLGLE